MASKWIKRWEVPRSDNNGFWVVAVDKDGNYGCSCPIWKFKRQECHHILEIKQNGGNEVKEKTPEELGELKLKAYATKGYRYYSWIHEPPFSYDRNKLESIKRNPLFMDVKTFSVNSYRIVVVKEKETAYEKEFNDFIDLIKKCNFRRNNVINPDYCPSLLSTDRYLISQMELRDKLRKKWFDITQHIVFNKTGLINPNLPQGSVYNSGYWGKKIVNLEKRYKFLR